MTTAKYMTHFCREIDVLDCSTKEHVKLDSGLSRSKLEAWIQSRVSATEQYNGYEIDISKYDKSQDELSLLVFAEILLREGVPYDVVKKWTLDHTSTTINFRGLGLKVKANFQRKSGDASTLHGNSRVLTVAMSWCIGDEGLVVKLIRGDDSFLLKTHGSGSLVNCLSGFSDLFNFETKLLQYDGSMFYAGNLC